MAQPPYYHSDRDGALPIRAEVKKIITDRAQSNVTYVCRSLNLNALESDPVWQISRESVTGNVSTLVYAADGQFNQRASDRTTLFPPAPFVNAHSLNFNGINNYVSAGDVLPFERTNPFSLSVWFRVGALGTNRVVLGKRDNTANARGYELFVLNSGVLSMILSSANVGNRIRVDTTAPILALTWYHAVVTYDGSSLAPGVQIYLNGVPQGVTLTENTLSGTILSTANFQMGAREAAIFPFFGHMDEPAVYNIALTPAQVLAIYNAGVPDDLIALSTTGNLLSWWRNGDDAFYPTILDIKGTNHATMINMSPTNITTVVP